MPIKSYRIKELRVFVVKCPEMDASVRVQSCRRCKNYCGEHGGDYVECSYEGE